MNLKRMLTIFYKDARSAVTDGRVLVAIAIPIAFALFFNFVLGEEEETTSITVAHTQTTSALPEALGAVTGDAAELSFEAGAAAEVRRMVADEEADIGLVAPQDFDAAVQSGRSPQLTVLLPESPSVESDLAAGSVDPALRALAGQGAPAGVQTETVEGEDAGNVIAQIGASNYYVLFGVGFLVVLVCMYALPIILTEETEKKTLDALVMVASYGEVVIAKALVGLLYIVVAVAVTLALTGAVPENLLLFGAAILLLSVVLTGFGLLMGGIFRDANQLNVWTNVVSLPAFGTIMAVFFPLPDAAERVLDFVPTSQATRLAVNGLSGESIFSGTALSFAVIIAWGVAAYLILLWTLRRRQA